MTALLTDLYEITMAYGYWKEGLLPTEGVFHLFFRKQPFGGPFAVAAGLETALQQLEKFKFSSSDLQYLESLKLFDPRFLEELTKFKLTCDIDAVPEGCVVFPYEPIIRVQGPIIQAQLIEGVLLNIINFQTLIATKASRVCLAASPGPVVEFGLRRAQGIDGALSASRAAFIGGCSSTSNTLAGKMFNIPVKGTMAHSWVQSFPSEMEAFEAWASAMPNNLVFLLDTYDTLRAARRVIELAKNRKIRSFGVRIDSGDLAVLSREVRKILDGAGFKEAFIMATNELDEVVITDLKRQGACIDVWGVGTHLVTGQTQPALDGVYKLSAVRQNSSSPWMCKIKKSEQSAKVTDPGILQVRRFLAGDVIYNTLDTPPTLGDLPSEDLLVPVVRAGKRNSAPLTLQEIQKYAEAQLGKLKPETRRFLNPQPYSVGREKSLTDLKQKLLNEMS